MRLAHLRRNIDPEWIVQAIEATGTATIRSRRLPAEQVVDLRASLETLILPPRRSERRFPRAVKIKMSIVSRPPAS